MDLREWLRGGGPLDFPAHDPDAVREWLERGHFGRSLHVVMSYSQDGAGRRMARTLQSAWAELALDVELRPLVQSAATVEALKASGPQITLADGAGADRRARGGARAAGHAPARARRGHVPHRVEDAGVRPLDPPDREPSAARPRMGGSAAGRGARGHPDRRAAVALGRAFRIPWRRPPALRPWIRCESAARPRDEQSRRGSGDRRRGAFGHA
mgnify:CR=1 FL=1